LTLQVLWSWRQLQQQAADARLLQELLLMHKAAQHRNRLMAQRSLLAWAKAAAAGKEEAAAQARKDQIWNKIQGWLAQDTERQTSIEAIIAAPFLQVRSVYDRWTCCIACAQQC